ncbi:methyl-accepting chemotaxis protein [Kineosporia sp. R_H_3]|uniref:methyl-accepting chemotaxis protein n=1 Tax=Kineosporia sp. R_H_3 TaxID=1961848 RepID=UPI000B4B44F8|nr:methyl-accepting chemotaxis protein [Kineosporia sp. R_H_3]
MSALTRTLGRKILLSFLALGLVLVVVGVGSLLTVSALNRRVEAVSSRAIVPLGHLRQAQNAGHGVVIVGFAGAATQDPTVRTSMQASAVTYQKQVAAELDALVTTTPADLRPQAQALRTTYTAFVAADEAYRADPNGPDAAARGGKASDLYQATEQQFEKLAGLLTRDAAAQAAAVAARYRQSVLTTALLVVAGILLGTGLGVVLARSVRRRTNVVLEALAGMARGDLTGDLPDLGPDELGRMGRALAEGLAAVRTALREVSGSATELAASAVGLSSRASETAESTERSARTVDEMATDADRVTAVVRDAAANTGELGSSIREISSNAQEAARIAGQAVGVVEATNATVSQLGNSSQEIGNVIAVIQNIAAQTSLLALNATIEAARAGEAGRGFAVVAGEVKELARETAEATDSVIQRVQAIQTDTEGAVAAIAEIGEIIRQINGYQSSIAAAVEEQSVTTESIGGSISHAQSRTEAIAGAAEQVSAAARGSNESVAATRALADDVARMSAQLERVVAGFRV